MKIGEEIMFVPYANRAGGDGRDQEQARAGPRGVDPSGAALRDGGAANEKLYIPGERPAHPGRKKDAE